MIITCVVVDECHSYVCLLLLLLLLLLLFLLILLLLSVCRRPRRLLQNAECHCLRNRSKSDGSSLHPSSFVKLGLFFYTALREVHWGSPICEHHSLRQSLNSLFIFACMFPKYVPCFDIFYLVHLEEKPTFD